MRVLEAFPLKSGEENHGRDSSLSLSLFNNINID